MPLECLEWETPAHLFPPFPHQQLQQQQAILQGSKALIMYRAQWTFQLCVIWFHAKFGFSEGPRNGTPAEKEGTPV